MLSSTDFELLKRSQYCDNPSCECFDQVDADNIRTQSRAKSQVYCKCCGNIWVVTKGTMYFGLKTPIEKVAQSLCMYARGMGLRNTCRIQGITADSLLDWLEKAGNHVKELSEYLQSEMDLDQVQIDEFWSFVLKKRDVLLKKRKPSVK
jgi:transposase-like protein